MKIVHWILAAAGAVLVLPASASQAVAFITHLKGEVAVDGSPRPQLLTELAGGEKIEVASGAAVSVMFVSSGKEYVLQGPGRFEVKATEVAGSAAAAPAVRSTPWRTSQQVLVQVAQSSAASVRMRSVGKPRDEPSRALVYPIEGKVATLQPTFRWRAADAKTPGELSVQQVGEEKPLHTAKAAGGAYRLPTKLKPDVEYAWSYAVDGHELGAGRFRTVPEADLQRLEQRRPGADAPFSDRLMFALLLQEVGATQDAREAWGQLAQERPDLPELAALARR